MPIIQKNHNSEQTKYSAFLTIPSGELAGKQLGMTFDVCTSPICECADMRIKLSEASSEKPLAEISLDVSARKKSEHSKEPLGSTQQLTETIFQSLDEADWKYLWNVFGSTKERLTDTLDPKKLEVDFPMADDIELHGELVSYSSILPHAQKFLIEFGDEMILLDEQYCLARDCKCDRVAVTFIAFEGEPRKWKQKEGEPHMVRVGYRTGQIIDIDRGNSTNHDPAALLKEFQSRFPLIMEIFVKRHKQLYTLYTEFKRRRQNQVQLKSMKIGRNEPCPCGSGKKYKKCCESLPKLPSSYHSSDLSH
jgi:hypothetical protein